MLTDEPSKIIQIPITITKADSTELNNSMTIFLDNAGALIGGSCQRPSNKGMNCSQLKLGTLSFVLDKGNSASFSITYWDGDQAGDFTITGDYDCAGPSYSSLAITESGTPSKNYDGTATLTTTGTITCQDIP